MLVLEAPTPSVIAVMRDGSRKTLASDLQQGVDAERLAQEATRLLDLAEPPAAG